MTKIGYSFICAVTFLFIGCAKPNALENFNYSKFYGNALQYTLKNDIVIDNNVVAMLNATYLNATNTSDEYKTKEVLLIGVFISDDNENKEYKITLNNTNPESIDKLDKNDKMYAKMPLYNPWAKYYIVKFDKNQLKKAFLGTLSEKQKYLKHEYKNINLSLVINEKQSTTLTFQKER